MKGQSYACLGGLEISNGNRVTEYIKNVGATNVSAYAGCECEALDDTYPFSDPETDNAPWFDANVPESADFLGVYLTEVNLQSVLARSAENKIGGGGVLGRLNLGKRVISCVGTLYAHTPSGMAYGERWLDAALAGSFCQDGCRGDDLEVLPACPETDEYADYDRFFRTLINTGLIDGPHYQPVQDDVPDCIMQEVDFQLVSASPYLYGPKETLLDQYVLTDSDSVDVLVSTNSWPGDGVVVILIENESSSHASGQLDITAKVTFDGTCTDVPGSPCWNVHMDSLAINEKLLIDGQREDLLYYNPTSKLWYPALSRVTTPGFNRFDWPSVPPCADVCWRFETGLLYGATITMDFYPREY